MNRTVGAHGHSIAVLLIWVHSEPRQIPMWWALSSQTWKTILQVVDVKVENKMIASHESFILDLKKGKKKDGKPCILNSSQSGFPDKPVWWASGTWSQLPGEKVAITHASLDFFDRRPHSAEPGISTSLLRLALAFLNRSRMLWSLVAPLSWHCL